MQLSIFLLDFSTLTLFNGNATYLTIGLSWVDISGTTAKSRQRKFVPSSHPGPFRVVATSQKSQTKVGTLACFDLL